MKNFLCIIKSHCDYPDYEKEFEAKDKKEAIKIILSDLGKYGWGEPEVAENIVELDKNGMPVMEQT